MTVTRADKAKQFRSLRHLPLPTESDPSERSRASPEKAKRAFVLGASRGARDATHAGSVKARGGERDLANSASDHRSRGTEGRIRLSHRRS